MGRGMTPWRRTAQRARPAYGPARPRSRPRGMHEGNHPLRSLLADAVWRLLRRASDRRRTGTDLPTGSPSSTPHPAARRKKKAAHKNTSTPPRCVPCAPLSELIYRHVEALKPPQTQPTTGLLECVELAPALSAPPPLKAPHATRLRSNESLRRGRGILPLNQPKRKAPIPAPMPASPAAPFRRLARLPASGPSEPATPLVSLSLQAQMHF
jgi:hypothetical protein